MGTWMKHYTDISVHRYTIFFVFFRAAPPKYIYIYIYTPVYRYGGNPIHWYTGTAAYRIPIHRYNGTPVHWHTGTWAHCFTVAPVHKYTGTPAHWYTERDTDTLILLHKYTGNPIHWYTCTAAYR